MLGPRREVRRLRGERVLRGLRRRGEQAVAPQQVEQGPGPEAEAGLREHLAAGERRGTGRAGMTAVVPRRLPSIHVTNSLALNRARHSSARAAPRARRAATSPPPCPRGQPSATARKAEACSASCRRIGRPKASSQARATASSGSSPHSRTAAGGRRRSACSRASGLFSRVKRLRRHDGLQPPGATGHHLGRVEGREHRVARRSAAPAGRRSAGRARPGPSSPATSSLASNRPVSSSLPSGGTTGGPNGLGLSRPEQASMASRIASPSRRRRGKCQSSRSSGSASQARPRRPRSPSGRCWRA